MSQQQGIQTKTRRIKVIKETGIKPKIKKLNKKSDEEIQTITEMFHQFTLGKNEPLRAEGPTLNTNPKRKSPSPSPPSVEDQPIRSVQNLSPELSMPLSNSIEFSTPHFAVLPIYLDLKTIQENYQKNRIDQNLAKLYPLWTRFLFLEPSNSTLEINPMPCSEELFDLNLYLQDKYGIEEDNVTLIKEMSVLPNLTLYLIYLKSFLALSITYPWKIHLELYNHIKESYHYNECYSVKLRGEDYRYETNPYRAILGNQMAENGHARNQPIRGKLGSIEGNLFKMTCLYQNIIENFDQVSQNQNQKNEN